MALVLRKAAMPKNIALFKCMKGRPLATSANKTSAAPLSKSIASRRLTTNAVAPLCLLKKSQKTEPVPVAKERLYVRRNTLRFCESNPNIGSAASVKANLPLRSMSCPMIATMSYSAFAEKASRSGSGLASFLQPCSITGLSKRSFSCKCPSPCGPYGCPGGCGCLPPPCNVPAKCIQYMTGYYYYPYGYWFCGPYHVAGTCYPCGPVNPSSPPPCPSGGSPCSCPPACCMCPAATAAAAISGLPVAPKANTPMSYLQNPPFDKDCPKPTARSGISKFFPFNTNANEPRRPGMPPVMSAFACLPFSTDATHHFQKTYKTKSSSGTNTDTKYRYLKPFSKGYAKKSCSDRYGKRRFSRNGF